MSKKSRRRNKKILAALALAGGAAMLGKRGVPQGVSGADKAAFTSDAAYKLPKVPYITKKSKIVPDVSDFQSRFKAKVGDSWQGPGEISGVASAVDHPIITQHRVPPGAMRRFSKGGSVKRGVGIAKRGFGRALRGKK
jgi:hypothetical protein